MTRSPPASVPQRRPASPEEPGRAYAGESLAERRARRRLSFLDAGLQVFGTTGYRTATVRQLWRDPMGRTGLLMAAAVLIGAVLGPLLAPFDRSDVADSRAGILLPPSAAHWLGTDELGRDVLRQVLSGTAVSLEIGLAATLFTILLGTTVGVLVSGARPTWVMLARKNRLGPYSPRPSTSGRAGSSLIAKVALSADKAHTCHGRCATPPSCAPVHA